MTRKTSTPRWLSITRKIMIYIGGATFLPMLFGKIGIMKHFVRSFYLFMKKEYFNSIFFVFVFYFCFSSNSYIYNHLLYNSVHSDIYFYRRYIWKGDQHKETPTLLQWYVQVVEEQETSFSCMLVLLLYKHSYRIFLLKTVGSCTCVWNIQISLHELFVNQREYQQLLFWL